MKKRRKIIISCRSSTPVDVLWSQPWTYDSADALWFLIGCVLRRGAWQAQRLGVLEWFRHNHVAMALEKMLEEKKKSVSVFL